MSDTDDDTSSYQPGCSTPPLSPTKTISTEGWLSPRTPASPRKNRSSCFTRVVDDDADQSFTPPASPTKSKATFLLGALSIPVTLHATDDITLPQSEDDSPMKQHVPRRTKRLIWSEPPLFDSLHTPLPSSTDEHPDHSRLPRLEIDNASLQHAPSHVTRRDFHRSVSDSLLEPSNTISCPIRCHSDIVNTNMKIPPTNADATQKGSSLTKVRRLPIRYASSPLRPSQWMSCGKSLRPPRKGQASIPDRFIACRRPPAVARESFELNKPSERLESQQSGRSVRSNADAFSHIVGRSVRLHDELRGLRETHSMIARRISANRRNTVAPYRRNSFTGSTRQVSAGAVWNVGGPSAVSDTVSGVFTGRGGMLGSGTNAPLYTSSFLNRADPEAELEAYERRLALALDVDQADRILQHAYIPQSHIRERGGTTTHENHVWRDSAWIKDGLTPLLDAPQLRDDYYCTLLAYSPTAQFLAVGLGNLVHLWSEKSGVETPESLNASPATNAMMEVQHVTSLDFSSASGGQAILAVGRADGRISLWSPFESEPRFDATQPKPVSCVSWRPTTIQRPSLRDRAMTVATEELLIGDEVGHIYFYSIEWPSEMQSAIFGWHGAMSLLARMTIHTQQICGLAWALDGKLFASGGNDNNCFLFETKEVLRPNNSNGSTSDTLNVREGPGGESIYTVTNRSSTVLQPPRTTARHKWTLNAAVKAMAFCPWQRDLIAIGGGSNDRCIHFYHTRSGTCLATIDCAAQVTGLVWSQTRREIAATFGFTQPEHPYRVAVFAWPSCEQIVAVPWWDEHRALCAVAYPGGPNGGPQTGNERNYVGLSAVEDGCIVVAASDMAIRFHEIWSDKRGSAAVGGLIGSRTAGLLGGSDILEGLNGITREDTVVR